jgi:hypothetical protein
MPSAWGISAIPAIPAGPSGPSTSLRAGSDDWRGVSAIPAIPATPSGPSTSLRAGPDDWRRVSAIPATRASPSTSLRASPEDRREVSAIPAIRATPSGRSTSHKAGPNDWRGVSAIPASDLAIAARGDRSTAARGNAARLGRDRAGSAWLACNGGARASRPKATDMGPNLSASVGRHTPQHCSVLSSAKRGLAADQGLWRPGLFAPRYIVWVVPEQRVTAAHALSPQPPPSHGGGGPQGRRGKASVEAPRDFRSVHCRRLPVWPSPSLPSPV